MDKESIISVVVVNYNCSLLVNRCLNSIFNNKIIEKVEVIFIDNASSDIDLIESELLSRVSIKVFNKINIGAGLARNLGVKKSSGKYICFLDSDDIFLENKLASQLDFLEKNKNYFMISTNYYRVNDYGRLSKKVGLVQKSGEIKYSDLVCTNSVILSSVMCRNNQNILKFEKGVREDYKLWLNISKKGYRIFFTSKPFVGYFLPSKIRFIWKKIPKLKEQWKIQRINSKNIFHTVYKFLIYGASALYKLWRT